MVKEGKGSVRSARARSIGRQQEGLQDSQHDQSRNGAEMDFVVLNEKPQHHKIIQGKEFSASSKRAASRCRGHFARLGKQKAEEKVRDEENDEADGPT